MTDQNAQQPLQEPAQSPQLPQAPVPQSEPPMKFCKHCGGKIPADAVICTLCGRQVEEVSQGSAPNIVINNSNQNTNQNVNQNLAAFAAAKARSKWVALALCFFLGGLGAHKFYEGKTGMGVLYIFTLGLFGIGVLIDFITLLFKPNPYYV